MSDQHVPTRFPSFLAVQERFALSAVLLLYLNVGTRFACAAAGEKASACRAQVAVQAVVVIA